MQKDIKKACELSNKVLEKINKYCEEYIGIDGRDLTTESSIMDLQEILENGFTLHNFIIEKKLNEGKPGITASLVNLEKYLNQLTINKENAEKLRLSNAIQVWNQAKIAIAVLADNTLNYYENGEE